MDEDEDAPAPPWRLAQKHLALLQITSLGADELNVRAHHRGARIHILSLRQSVGEEVCYFRHHRLSHYEIQRCILPLPPHV